MDVFGAVADPVRREIVELLVAQVALPAGQIADAVGSISRPAVSRHLRVLRDAHVVECEVVGRERIYRVDLDALGAIEGWIAALRPRWAGPLDALETEVARTRRERERSAHPFPAARSTVDPSGRRRSPSRSPSTRPPARPSAQEDIA